MSYLEHETEFHITKSDDGNCFFEMGDEEVVNESMETFLTTNPFQKDITLYHGSTLDLDVIKPLKINTGTKISSPRYSSFWGTDRFWCIAYSIQSLLNKNGVITILNTVMREICKKDKVKEDLIAREKDKRLIEKILRHGEIYIYCKKMPKKYVGIGHNANYSEYSIDVPVRPDTKEVLRYNDFKDITVKYVSDAQYDNIFIPMLNEVIERGEKHGHAKWLKHNDKKRMEIRDELKSYKESGVENMNRFEQYISGSSSDSISEKTYMTEEAKYDKENKYPVYIILTDADSPMAKMIKKYTGQDWAHALIAFNSDLEPAYSFGCTSIKPMKFGFISKSEEDPFRDQEKAKYEVLLMYVNKTQYDKMQKKLNWYLTHKEDLKYSFSGLGFFGLNIPKQIKDKYFCSQFVMDIIGEAFTISKDPSLWSPGDIENLDNLSIIDKGNDLRYFDKKSLVKNTKFVQKGLYNKIHFNESVEDDDIFEEAGDPAKTHYFLENVGKRVDKAFEDPKTAREFNKLVSNYINRNIDKLTKSGPCDMIPFTDNEHKAFQELFGFWYEIDNRPKKTSPNEIRDLIITYQKENKIKVDYWLNNSSQILFYFVIRYFTMKKDSKSLNNALAIYALCVYPVMFHKYFPYGVMEPFMQYTIDHLTDKFIIKRSKHLFDALMQSIQNSYKFHKNNFAPASDKNMTDWTHRIRNDQNSLLKKISNEYMYNWKHGNAARTQNEEYDDSTPIVDEIENGTTVVQNIVNKVTLPIIEDGVDLRLSAAAAKMANVGVSDCRFFLTEIIVNDNLETLQRFIEAILFLYIYEEKKGERDIRSQYFIAWAVSLFKKTNSKNENIGTINAILNEWAAKSGIDDKFSRVASRINYKKAIFFYIILSIQKNI